MIALILVLLVFLILLPDLILCGKLLYLRPRLTDFCRKKGYEITWEKRPFPWALRFHEGADFCVKTGDRLYCVDLLAARRRNREYFFAAADKLIINRRLLTKIVGRNRVWLKMDLHAVVSTSREKRIYLSDVDRAGEVKVLLLYPVARDAAWDSRTGGKRPLGNGDLFWNSYRFFTLSGFLDELDSPGKYLRTAAPWE